MPPLIDPLDTTAPEIAEAVKFFNETLGFCPNSVLTMQRRPEIAAAFIALNKAVMTPDNGVDSQLKRMIGYVASHAAGCQYCQAHTALAAERYGVSDEKFADVWTFEASPHFTDAEKAALEFAIAAATVPNGVTPEVSDRLRANWRPDQIVEILGVVALFGYLNRWNDSMGTSLEDGAKSAGDKHLSEKGWTGGKHTA